MADQNSSVQFIYEPVNKASQQIRLLQFKNIPFRLENFKQEPLECSMVAVSLGQNPDYRTLSYVWGDDTRCKPLLVDGKLIQITTSLDIALRHLMLFQDLLKQQIWIDAVCINQDDSEEKAWQVRMMKDIYLSAKSSIGWLGLADDVSRLAIETVWESKLYLDFVRAFDRMDIVEDLLRRITKDVLLAPAKGNLRRNAAINLFIDRPFFARTWIYQEVMVAKHLDIVCGTDVCDWEDLHIAKLSLAKHYGDSAFGDKFDFMGLLQLAATTGPLLGSMGPKCFQLRNFFEQNHLAYNLWSLVVLTRAGGAQSRNSRDAIYGVLSVAADAKKLNISPDYDAPVEQCFIQAAKAFLRHGHLDVLTACQQPRKLMSLPTWVPDFSTRWDDDFNIVTPIEFMGKAAEDTVYGNLYCASKGSSPKIFSFEKRGHHQLRCVAGIKFDPIKAIAPALDRNTFDGIQALKSPDAIQDALLAQIKGVQDLLRSECSHTCNSLETILRVLTKDLEFRSQAGGHILHRLPSATLKSYVPYVTLLKQCRPLSAFPAVGMRQEYLIFSRMILSKNVGRRAFISSRGLGIGPAVLQEGDVVAIICGTDVPLLMRPCDGGVYKLVGEAYVDGIMDGEAMKDSSISMFEIC